MVIGIDASRANRKFKTGTEWYSYHLIQALKKISLTSNRVILFSSDKLKGSLGDLPKGWEARVLAWPPKYLWTQIRLCWEMFINPIEVLFVPAHSLPMFSRAKSVLTIHDLGFKRFPRAYSLWQRIYYSFVHWWGARRAVRIIVPSEFTKKELIEIYKVNPRKIAVIPLAYDEKNYKVIEDEGKIESILTKYKIEKPYFFYVGRLERKKNIKGLIKAYKLLIGKNHLPTNPKLVLAGRPGYGYQEIRREMDNNKDIITIDYIDPKDLVYLYNAAMAFVFPSFYEGFGIPVLEAMASGAPVVASKAASLPEIADQAALYFDPQNPDEMAGLMEKIIKDEGLKNNLREKGLKQIQKFSWQKCAEETMTLLSSI